MMEFYTTVSILSQGYWVSLCLENGVVGQGKTKQESVDKLQEAVSSLQIVLSTEKNVYSSPILIKELHEFLSLEDQSISQESYELRKIYA